MKKAAFVLAISGVVTLLSASLSAQTAKPVPTPVLVAKVDEMKTVLKLTDDQVKKMMDLIAETEKSKKTLETDFAPVKAEYDKALAANDQAAIKAAVEKWTALYAKQGEINNKGTADIDSFLTDAQRTQWYDHKYLAPILKSYEKVGITDEQLAKIMAEFKRCLADGIPSDVMGQYQLSMKLRKIIDKEVLTEEQQVKLVVEPMLAQYKSVDLTAAQITKINEQAHTFLKAAEPDDPLYAISGKVANFIRKDVLTDDQRGKAVLNPILGYYKRAELTDEQVGKVKEQLTQLMKDSKPEDPGYMLNMKLSQFIMDKVLTAEQRTKMGFPAPAPK